MSSGAPWSVKGIDPKTREVAKDLARRSGMTLGEWLNTVIANGGDEPDGEPVGPAPSPLREEPALGPGPGAAQPGELARVTAALERLTARIEAAEHRSSLAISGVDQSVQGVLARLGASESTQAAVVERLDGVERDQTAVAARLDAALMAMRDDHEQQAARLHKLEEEGAGPRSAEALKSIETALGKVAGQLYESESRTRAVLGEIGREFDAASRRIETLEARPHAETVVGRLMEQLGERLERAEAQTAASVSALQTSFADLDTRLRAAEARPVDDGGERLERLAADLSARMDAVRAELAGKLDAAEAGDGRLDQLMGELSAHVAAAEQRSHQAVEKMGQEVLRIAGVINRRMQQVEHRTADAVEQVGGEVARVADAMEARLRASDHAHAGALERLGGEIARISERLADRIAAAERRSAEAIDEVGEQVGRATEKLNARYDRAANDLAERIKQSEERTARFLEEAREKLDLRLAETQTRIVEQVTPVQQSFADVRSRLEQVEAATSYMPPFGKTLSTGASDANDIFVDGPLRAAAPRPEPKPEPAFSTPQVLRAPEPTAAPAPAAAGGLFAAKPAPAFTALDDDSPFEPLDDFGADVFAPEPEAAADAEAEPLFADPDPEPEPDLAEPPAPLSTRDVLERARAAARANAGPAAPQPAAQPAKGPGLLGALKLGGSRLKATRRPSTLKTALAASATAAALGATAAGWVILAQDGPRTETAALEADATDRVLNGDAALRPAGAAATPQAASLVVEPQNAAVVAPSPTAEQGAAAYARAKGALEEGRTADGVAALRQAADLGHAPAQLHLANLYETGESGVARNPAEARKWTERAARAGERRAMHNLGLLYFEGQGGPKNVGLAAQWFRRAAELGLVDSQYNLGLVHEKGFGVTRNPAEAYKWYIIAARNGDTGARSAAERLEPTLSDQARATAERSALAFRAGPGATPASATAGVSADVAAAQRALSILGYYQGPADGRPSPALTAAVSAWQQATGQAPDGVVDRDVLTALARAG